MNRPFRYLLTYSAGFIMGLAVAVTPAEYKIAATLGAVALFFVLYLGVKRL